VFLHIIGASVKRTKIREFVGIVFCFSSEWQMRNIVRGHRFTQQKTGTVSDSRFGILFTAVNG